MSFEFKRAQELYVKDYTGQGLASIQIGEFKVRLPRRPRKEDMENYGLPKKQQKFRRTKVPRDLPSWPKALQREFVEAEWHKRIHGVWVLVNGQPIYLTGRAYVFFNYWYCEYGGLPKFRMEAVRFFLFAEMCINDNNCLGFNIVKCRRVGDTEKCLFLGWEITTRYYHSHFGMQNYTGTEAQKNFLRVVNGHNKMIFFFKPVTRGSDEPTTKLDMQYPGEKISKRKLEAAKEKLLIEDNMIKQGLMSYVDHANTVTRAYDGTRMSVYHLDEQSKVNPKDMDVEKQHEIVQKCLTLFNDTLIIGLMMVSSTIEPVDKEAQSLKKAKKIYDESDPKKRDGNGRTASGLYRYFRDFTEAAPVDEFGFHRKDWARKKRRARIEYLQKLGLQDKIIDLKRKQPANADEAFSLPDAECILYPQLLDRRMHQIKYNLSPQDKATMPDGSKVRKKAVRGDLVWLPGAKFAGVQWIENPNGRWTISQHPTRPNSKMVQDFGNRKLFAPTETRTYAIGVDPIDSTSGSGSKMAITVFRKPDWLVDNKLEKDETGRIIDTWNMRTNQVVCTYKARPNSPSDSLDDLLKTLIYYSSWAFIEMQKGAYFRNTLNERGWSAYLQIRPIETYSAQINRKAAIEQGAAASESLIRLGIDLIKAHLSRYIATHHHYDLLEDMGKFNNKKEIRTKRDETVSFYYALLGAYDEELQTDVEQDTEEWVDAPWHEFESAY